MKLSNFKYDYEYDWVIKKTLKKDQENQESKTKITIDPEEEKQGPAKAPSKP